MNSTDHGPADPRENAAGILPSLLGGHGRRASKFISMPIKFMGIPTNGAAGLLKGEFGIEADIYPIDERP